MYSRGRLLFLARSRLLFGTQKEFLESLCKPNPNIRPKDWVIPVVTAARGFRKTTTAKEVADASNGTITHKTQAEIKSKKDLENTATDAFAADTGLPARLLKILWEAVMDHPKAMRIKEKYMPEKEKCIILDDVMSGFKDSDQAEQLRNFLTKLHSRLRYKYFVIITSNEGFLECISDPTTASRLIKIHHFPPSTVSELTVFLKDALQNRSEDFTKESFADVPAQITSDLITEKLVASVVEQLPIRHGFSMRVWGRLLSHIDANTPPEALSVAVIETLKNKNFLLSVAEKVDLEVAQLSSINGLLKSDEMPEEEIKKLANLLNLTLTPTAPLKVPGRLVLISLLKMAKVRDAEDLHDRLEEKQVRPKIGRIIEDFEGRC